MSDDVYLPTKDGTEWPGHTPVHDELVNAAAIRQALQQLGVGEASAEAQFESALNSAVPNYSYSTPEVNEGQWASLWELSRGVDAQLAVSEISNRRHWQSKLHVKAMDGEWKPAHSVLIPGAVVSNDGSRDSDVAIDMGFHRNDETLLRRLGVSDRPHSGWDVDSELAGSSYFEQSRREFSERAYKEVGRTPRESQINFESTFGVGPVELLAHLSESGRVAYTNEALNERGLYTLWKLRHDTQEIYRTSENEQPAIAWIKLQGRIKTTSGIVPFAEALGEGPANREAQRILLDHANVDLIRGAFDLHDPPPIRFVPINSSSRVPISEVWPNLVPYLNAADRSLQFSRCDEFVDETGDPLSALAVCDGSTVFVLRMDREDELDTISDELGVRLEGRERRFILNRIGKEEITAARNAVRAKKDDESRLLQAIGEEALLSGLPQALTEYYNRNGHRFEGEAVAKAVISTFHTGALKEYRHALAHLDPPRQWAGSSQAIQFVTELGFAPEWAGERGSRRDPFLEVPGPIVLPPLHDYQNIVANKLRQMLRSSERVLTDRRAMISLPTGSGKTRVAVEGTITSITEDGFHGGVLWVADRDELCEQAVPIVARSVACEGQTRPDFADFKNVGRSTTTFGNERKPCGGSFGADVVEQIAEGQSRLRFSARFQTDRFR